MSSYTHPTGRVPERVTMLLLGESKKDFADGLAVAHDPPWPDSELWTCNAGFRIWPHQVLFVMDDLEGEAYKWPVYGDELARHAKPIITSTAYPRWPTSIDFPFREVVKDLGLKGLDIWFHNTVPYMLAYALWIGVEHINIFGADYWHPHAAGREGDIENAHFWLGMLRGRGMTLSVAPNSTMMAARHSARPLYGYRHDPRIALEREARAFEQMRQASRRREDPVDVDLSPGARELVEQAEQKGFELGPGTILRSDNPVETDVSV